MLSIVLLFLGFIFLLSAEFFLPTSGFLGLVSAILLIAANVLAFSISPVLGFSTLVLSIFVTVLMVVVLVRIWPHTPVGRRILNLKPEGPQPQPTLHRTRDGDPMNDLLGKRGTAKTEMLPSGLVVIENHKYDAITQGEPIKVGSSIEVVRVTAGKLQVQLVSDAPNPLPARSDESSVRSPEALEVPLDSLEIE